jgi:hypothetical protein
MFHEMQAKKIPTYMGTYSALVRYAARVHSPELANILDRAEDQKMLLREYDWRTIIVREVNAKRGRAAWTFLHRMIKAGYRMDPALAQKILDLLAFGSHLEEAEQLEKECETRKISIPRSTKQKIEELRAARVAEQREEGAAHQVASKAAQNIAPTAQKRETRLYD